MSDSSSHEAGHDTQNGALAKHSTHTAFDKQLSDTAATNALALCCPNVILDWLLTMAGVARDVVCTGLTLGIRSYMRLRCGSRRPVITDQVLADTLSPAIISDQ